MTQERKRHSLVAIEAAKELKKIIEPIADK